MLLKQLYDFAVSRNLLDDLAFAPKSVRWLIDLNINGELMGLQPTGDDKRGKEFSCPQTTRPKVAGGVSEFLADGLTAVFGLDADPEATMSLNKRADRDKNNERKYEDFWKQIHEAASLLNDPKIKAVSTFGSNLKCNSIPPFLRWGTASDSATSAKSVWWVKSAVGTEVRLGPENFSFRIDGEIILLNEILRKYWQEKHAEEIKLAQDEFPKGLCLVSGKREQPLAPTHNPKIQGVPNTQSFGAAIVSFDKEAFVSYGFTKSLNAGTSIEVSTAYCVALNWLLSRDDHHSRLGQTSFCYWAKQSDNASSLFSRLLNRPDTQTINQFLKTPFSGVERELSNKELFFTVTLAGNSGRIVVRHWKQQPLDQCIENFRKWFVDLELLVPNKPLSNINLKREKSDNKDNVPPLAIFRLACTTVREAKDLFPDVTDQLFCAAFEGTVPSRSLLKPILNELCSKIVRKEQEKNYSLIYDESRFSLIKLILNRNRKPNNMEIKPQLLADTDDAAYNCGRLLAILADTQKKAHEYKLEGAGIAERYFGTAIVSPASVFPLLLRLNRHHLNKIGKSDRFAGQERFIQQQIGNVLSLFKSPNPGQAPAFPRTLDLQSQGTFAIGFYQQLAANENARQSNKKENNQ